MRAVLVMMLASWASSAAAHDTWLLPGRFQLPVGGRIELEPTSGMGFPAPESAVPPARLDSSGLRIGGRSVPPPLEIVPLADPTTLRVGSPLSEASSSPDADWQSVFTTLAVHVRSPR